MGVNAKGVFLGTKVAIPVMRAGGSGSIVNISSIAGIGQSTTQEPAYAASKGAIRVFSKVTATQHAKDNIRCNYVHPGPVDTEMLRAAFPTPEALAERLSRVPMRRAGLIDEIVSGVLYLASDESSYVTGTELVIDGGVAKLDCLRTNVRNFRFLILRLPCPRFIISASVCEITKTGENFGCFKKIDLSMPARQLSAKAKRLFVS